MRLGIQEMDSAEELASGACLAWRRFSLFSWLVADDWCWFVLREEYCWLVAGGYLLLLLFHGLRG
jgi:hypothetical protein